MKKWMKIVDDLIEDMIEGRYTEDIKLPSESKLVERYDVSRHEVRKAFEHLTDMGYIYSVQGKGRYYKSKKDKIPLELNSPLSFTEKMEKAGHELENINIQFQEIKDSPKLRYKFNIEGDTKIYKISRLRKLNGEPAAIHISYLTDKVFKNIEEDGPYITSIYEYFKKMKIGKRYGKGADKQIMLPTSFEREVLCCPQLVPVMMLEGISYDCETDEVIEISKVIYRGDRFIFR